MSRGSKTIHILENITGSKTIHIVILQQHSNMKEISCLGLREDFQG